MTGKPYSKYKPSGVEWLGDVPEHWEVKRLKREVQVADRKVEADEDNPLPYVGLENIESGSGRLLPVDATTTPSGIANLFNAGQVLFGKLRPYLAKACVADCAGLCSTELLVLQSVRAHPKFLLYLLLSKGFIDLVDSSTYGTKMPRSNWDFIGNCEVPFPPVEEQDRIAAYLDRETARIDALVGKKSQLIEKLQEKRAALISRTVTRGLPPEAAKQAGLDTNPKLKPSNIPWPDEIPEHWKSGNLRRFASMRTGHTPSRHEAAYWEDCHIPWFTLADVWQIRDGRTIYLGDPSEKISALGLENSAADLLPAGTVILSRTASVGYSGIMPVPMATSQDFWNWVPGEKLDSKYLLFVFRAMSQEFERLTMGSTHKTIYQPDAARLAIPLPPRPEQQGIAAYLTAMISEFDLLVDNVEAAIGRLIEYRSALITAAVTGKVDAT